MLISNLTAGGSKWPTLIVAIAFSYCHSTKTSKAEQSVSVRVLSRNRMVMHVQPQLCQDFATCVSETAECSHNSVAKSQNDDGRLQYSASGY